MRIAYADPPYPGCAHLYPEKTEVDHAELIKKMTRDYDAWVLHTGAGQVRQVLPLCPEDVRLLAWVQGWAPFKPAASIKYAWQPVILYNPRTRKTGKGEAFVRDWLMCNAVTNRQGAIVQDFVGGKPEQVCHWIFECMGLTPEDELDDLFPGTGAVSFAWQRWSTQLKLEIA